MIWFFVAVNLLVIFAWSWLIWMKSNPLIRKFFWPAWFLKLMSGVGIGLLYTYYYPASDTITYHDDAEIMADFARRNFAGYLDFLWHGDGTSEIWPQISSIQPRALFIVKIVSVVSLMTEDNYWVSSMYFSLLSLWGVWKLCEEIMHDLPAIRFQLVASFLFLPSFVFWSSGLIKESIAVAALFYLCALVIKAWFYRRLELWEWIILPFALLTLWNLKYYYLAMFAPIVFAMLSSRYLFQKYKRVSFGVRCCVWSSLLIAPLIIMAMSHPNLHPKVFLEVIVANYEDFVDSSQPEGVIFYKSLEPTISSVVVNSPKALFSGFFRPLPWEAHTIVQVLDAIENTIILIITLFALTRIKLLAGSPYRLLIGSALLYCLILCLFLAMSTPNFGSLARYRVGFMPFYVLVITLNNPLINRISALAQRN
ncbi:MAG: hypothetical protein ABIS36_18935 [Chryseolinea sp.]